MSERGRLVRVGVAANQAEAEMLAGLLRDSGIECLLIRTGGTDVPDFLAAGPRNLMVAEGRADQAREILGTQLLPGEAPRQVDARRLLAGVLIGTCAVFTLAVLVYLLGG